MGPTPRDWLGAGLLAAVLLVLIVILVATAMGADNEVAAALRAAS